MVLDPADQLDGNADELTKISGADPDPKPNGVVTQLAAKPMIEYSARHWQRISRLLWLLRLKPDLP